MKVRVICNHCGKSIFLKVAQRHLKNIKGGIFRVATVHKCGGEEKVIMVFLDKNLSIRGKEICPLVQSTDN
ncbi:MAG: hypothetical protein ACTSYR_04685 [Candidatus Odinarchaeia archaeon]